MRSHVIKELRKKGYYPFVYDNLTTDHQWAVRKGELIEGDLKDKSHVQQIPYQEKPMAVMHFVAASSIVSESLEATLGKRLFAEFLR